MMAVEARGRVRAASAMFARGAADRVPLVLVLPLVGLGLAWTLGSRRFNVDGRR